MGEPLPIHREFEAAIEGARTKSRLVDLSSSVWRAHHAGGLSAEQAQAFAELIHVRTTIMKTEAPVTGFFRPISLFPPRRPQRPRKRAASIARRRQLALSGPLPPALAARFTMGENAVLKIVSDEVFATGRCVLDLAQIAARAGVCRSLAQQTLRRAARMDLVAIEERRRKGAKNLPNVVTIVDRDWLAWLYRGARLRRREAIGSKKAAPTGRQASEKEAGGINSGRDKAASDPGKASHSNSRLGFRRLDRRRDGRSGRSVATEDPTDHSSGSHPD